MRGLTLLFLPLLLWAMPDDYWAHEEGFELKKDQFVSWEVGDRILFMRWSLFHNRGLVVHIKYDHFPVQNILYEDYKRNSMKIRLKTQPPVRPPEPYARVVFERYDEESESAHLRIYLFDPLGVVEFSRAE
jgi:hypothetical protein